MTETENLQLCDASLKADSEEMTDWPDNQSRWTEGGGITNSCSSIPVDKADGAARPAYRQLQLSSRFIGHRQNAHKFQLIPCAEQHNQNVQR